MRRRGFAFGRQAANPNIPPALEQAHALMAQGNYAQAALAFERLAAGAENRMGPRAPFLFLQAGRARILMNETRTGMDHIRHGLQLLAASGRLPQLFRAGHRTVQELKARGLEKEAQEISEIIRAHGGAIEGFVIQGSQAPAQGKLPTHCPACGGPLRADEADWIDAFSAECPYCGSPVQVSP